MLRATMISSAGERRPSAGRRRAARARSCTRARRPRGSTAANGERAPARMLVAVRASAPVAAMPPKNGHDDVARCRARSARRSDRGWCRSCHRRRRRPSATRSRRASRSRTPPAAARGSCGSRAARRAARRRHGIDRQRRQRRDAAHARRRRSCSEASSRSSSTWKPGTQRDVSASDDDRRDAAARSSGAGICLMHARHADEQRERDAPRSRGPSLDRRARASTISAPRYSTYAARARPSVQAERTSLSWSSADHDARCRR